MGSLIALLEFILAALSIPPTAILTFMRSNVTVSIVGLTLASAAAISTITAKSFGFSLRDLLNITLRLVYYAALRLFKGRTVIILCDADEHNVIARTFARKLGQEAKSHGLRFRAVAVSSGSAIVGFPLLPVLVQAVVLIVTDVTPLSVETKRRELIQHRLIKYATAGGTLLLFHDTLYRRTRNELLQKFAGGKITHFSNCPVVHYTKYRSGPFLSRNSALLAELPDNVSLSDKELLGGEWDAGVEFLYVKAGSSDVPLITRRECGEGVVFWLNSGDTDKAGPAGSVAVPELPLISLVEKFIRLGHPRHAPHNSTEI